ncbi:hypothetical protein BDV98DRAFT_572407 [Pterulicium gracile]|uniref:Uncharacterized protein n=1 Tax=Pterulicium gracile TaxID=1884261 RepID=A0A5C3QA17_9AGAR|nr:hypothetical protein BDV98DRAFT_572407 [Pterula gracilis]
MASKRLAEPTNVLHTAAPWLRGLPSCIFVLLFCTRPQVLMKTPRISSDTESSTPAVSWSKNTGGPPSSLQATAFQASSFPSISARSSDKALATPNPPHQTHSLQPLGYLSCQQGTKNYQYGGARVLADT